MKLFVWTDYCQDYSTGLAFAIAENIEQAEKLLAASVGYLPEARGQVQELPITEPVAFQVYGGS